MAEKTEQVPAIGVSLQAVVAEIQIVFQTHFDGSLSPEQQDAKLDTIMERIERQKAKHNVPTLERQIRKARSALQGISDRLDAVDKEIDDAHAKGGRSGPARSSEPQKAQRKQLESQQKEALENILYEESLLTAVKAKFGIYEDKPKKAVKAA